MHPLYIACDWGSLPHVELLLAHGAPVNQETARGAPIHAAAVRGRLDIVEQLLAHGATVDAAVRWKSHTPVMLAARGGHLAIVRRLVEAGADTQLVNDDGDTLLHFATGSGNADLVRFVLPLCNAEQANHSVNAAVLRACDDSSAEFDEVLDVLLTAGARVDAVDDDGWSAFCALATNGRFEAVKRLVQRGVMPVHFQTRGLNLVYFAAERGHVEMLRWLLEQCVAFDLASTGLTAQVGETPLLAAAEAGHVEALRLLADAGADMRHATESGDTPLRVAARNGHGDCVRLLLRRGVKAVRDDIVVCVEYNIAPDALIALIANGCNVDAALAPRAKHPVVLLVLWLAGVTRREQLAAIRLDVRARVGPDGCERLSGCRRMRLR